MKKLKWRNIPGYPDYQVTKCGKVRSVEREREEYRNGKWQTRTYPSRRIKPNLHHGNPNAYYKVQLCYGLDFRIWVSVHKLVMLAWGKNFDPSTKIKFRSTKHNLSLANLKQTNHKHGK